MSAGVIDLHLHTTASDGLLEPAALVDLAWRVGIRVMSVTDHDTVAALAVAERSAVAAGMEFVSGIEITAVHEGRDVHMLGYFFDRDDAELKSFLEEQRANRAHRLDEIADKLASLGKPVDVRSLVANRPPGASLSRPLIAKALVTAGHVSDVRQAFEQLIGEGRPGFVERRGPSTTEVIGIIGRAGGVSSLAHPGLLKRDDLIPAMIDAGLSAIEVFHSEHDQRMTEHYIALAERYGLPVSGGSDYHGDKERRREAFGSLGLPADRFERLRACVRRGN